MIKWLWLSLIIPATISCAGQDGPLSLPIILDKIEKTNPALSSAEFTVDAAEAAAGQAGRPPNPSLNVEAEDPGAGEITATLSMPVPLGGKIGARKEAAGTRVSIARLARERTRIRLRAEAERCFILAQGLMKQRELLDSASEMARRTRENLIPQIAAGAAGSVDSLRASAEITGLAIETRRLEQNLRDILEDLYGMWGETAPDNLPVLSGSIENELTQPPFDRIAATIDSMPDIRNAWALVRSQEAEAWKTRSETWPDIVAEAGFRRRPDENSGSLLVGLSMDLPFLDRKKEAVRENDLLAKARQADADVLKREILTRLRKLNNGIVSCDKEAELLRIKTIPQTEQLRVEIQKRYAFGKATHLELLTAQKEAVAGKRAYMETRVRRHLLRIDMEEILGRPLNTF